MRLNAHDDRLLQFVYNIVTRGTGLGDRAQHIAPGYQLEVLREWRVNTVLGDEQPGGIAPAEVAPMKCNSVSFLHCAKRALGNAKPARWLHAGQAEQRIGVITLARCDQQAAGAARWHER